MTPKTLRTRITMWHSAVLVVSLGIAAVAFHFELRENVRAARAGDPNLGTAWEETVEFLVFGGLPVAAILVTGSAWFIRRAMTPVQRLTEAAERLHLDRLPEPLALAGTDDELDRLTKVFNAMVRRLNVSFAEVRDFTLNASHELRTPLTVMRGELELALRDETCGGEQRELLAGLLDEVQRLSKIVEGLLLLTKADAGQRFLKLEPVRLDELVHESFEDAQLLARASAIEVTLETPEPTVISGDRHRLRQLLLQLTDNAIKYNIRGGEIRFSLGKTGTQAELCIRNTGAGIPAEVLPKVFDRFFRGDLAHGTQVEGCGLGLSVARGIVQAHQGEIVIQSTPGKVTTVTVRLPLLPERHPRSPSVVPL